MNLNVVLLSILWMVQPEFRPGKLLPDSPNDAAWNAATFLQKALEAEAKLTARGTKIDSPSYRLRFISLYNLSTHGVRRKIGGKPGETEPYSPLDDMVKVLLFVVNQTNRINPPATLVKIKDDLFAVPYDSPGWTTESWDTLASKDVYFKREWVQESTWNYLCYYTGTQYPIMRADQFVSLSMLPPDYYNLLGLPDDVTKLKELLGTNEKLLTDAYRIKAGVKTDGLTVTINNRILERRQGAFDLWSSNDVVNSKGRKNALRQLDVVAGDIHKLDIDGQEHVFELGWGGWGGFLNNAQGKRVDEVPINIARDDNFRDYRVIVGRSCVVCHDQGIKPFASDQASLLANQVIQLRTINSQDAIALAGRYDEKMVQRSIRTDQENYRAAIDDLVGTTPEKISAMFANTWRTYNEERVTLEQAARECGLPSNGLVAVVTPAIDPNLLKFLELDENKNPRTLARDVWEDVFDDVMLLKGRPAPKENQQALPVVSGEKKRVPKIDVVPVPADGFEIVGKILLKKPAAAGETQTAKITIKSKTPFTVKSFTDLDKTVHLQLTTTEPLTEQLLTITFTATQAGFPSEVGLTLDDGKKLKVSVETEK